MGDLPAARGGAKAMTIIGRPREREKRMDDERWECIRRIDTKITAVLFKLVGKTVSAAETNSDHSYAILRFTDGTAIQFGMCSDDLYWKWLP